MGRDRDSASFVSVMSRTLQRRHPFSSEVHGYIVLESDLLL